MEKLKIHKSASQFKKNQDEKIKWYKTELKKIIDKYNPKNSN
jgi:hypothetical protein